MRAQIVKPGINGEGIALLEGKPVFIPGAIPEETVEFRIKDEQPTYARGHLIKVLKPSDQRKVPECPYAKECGGCSLMHVKYPFQLTWKETLLKEALWKYAHVKDTFVRPIRPSEKRFCYRSALKLPVTEDNGVLVSGMYKPGTNHFVAIDQCIAHDKKLEAVRRTIIAIIHEEQVPAYQKGHGLRYLIMRRIDGKISVALITGKDTLSKSLIDKISVLPEVSSIVQSINSSRRTDMMFGSKPVVLYGKEAMTVTFAGLKVSLSAESFFQLNLEQAKALYETAVSKCDPCDTLVEAYCGVGVMSLMASSKAKTIIGIEEVPGAIESAAKNAAANGIENVTFVCDDSAKGLQKILKQRKVNTLLCDPPRSGLDQAMINTILNGEIDKIIYVSCNPSTLGKNLGQLKQAYTVRTIIPFDLFPNTPHVESVTVLTRIGTSDRQIKQKRYRKEKQS